MIRSFDTGMIRSHFRLLVAWMICGGLFASKASALEASVIPGTAIVQIVDGSNTVFLPSAEEGALVVFQPIGKTRVSYAEARTNNGTVILTGGGAPGLSLTETYRPIGSDLLERVVKVTATSDQRYYLELGWKAGNAGDFYSFAGPEKSARKYSPGCSGPEFTDHAGQTFPMLGYRAKDRFYGIIGDTPGLWENRSFMGFDPEHRELSLTTGDGTPSKIISIPTELDATSVYRARFDGWQHLEAGETATFTTWIFSSPVRSLYDIQLAAHLALANAKGFNSCGLEAILRNTSYLLLRRNLLRPESDYIFISGFGYGWKQWVSDAFWVSRGLDDPKFEAAAYDAVFYDRLNYEDNSQYYLIWSALLKRAGGHPDLRTVKRAYAFIRSHERDGLYIPPRLNPERPTNKTYHDQLPYDDGDAPSSDQGFQCGALLAAQELGLGVTDQDIAKAIHGYQQMFNATGGYMATSLKQQDHIGQDSLYGEVLTFVVFGRKLLPDEMVRQHLETSVRIQSPYGMRDISKANGDLLDGHSGAYVYGGSWFLNDGANYLDGLIHGMDAKWVDDHLLWRLEKELAYMPAFNESISTVTGKPYGHYLYSWNSGFWRLRREVRSRLGLSGADPLSVALDKELGISRQNGLLVLDPAAATLRPSK